MLANGGWRVAPVVIERITDAQDQVLYAVPPAALLDEAQHAVPARNVFVTNSLLNGVTRAGTAARAQQQLQRVAVDGKTGTTNDAVDAWFAGFHAGSVVGVGGSGVGGTASTGLVAVAWIGFDQPQSLGARESGGGLALPIWIDCMAQALKQVPVGVPPAPPDGLLHSAGDWVYSEWAEGGGVSSVGIEGVAASAQVLAAVQPPPALPRATLPGAPPAITGR